MTQLVDHSSKENFKEFPHYTHPCALKAADRKGVFEDHVRDLRLPSQSQSGPGQKVELPGHEIFPHLYWTTTTLPE